MMMLLLLGSFACSTSNLAKRSPDTVPPKDTRLYVTLMDYLKTVPGVQVQRDFVTIRGNKSFNSNQEPLYVINGSIIGNSYERANRMIDPNDIKSVNVIKDVASTSYYGLRGSNGVIVIRTKNQG